MTIRTATDQDIPSIVALLKLSLGEGLMPKSEAFWRWKHVDNPFGKSDVLLAFDGDTLIGVRAFMKWEWVDAKRIYKSVRAVDTATHPKYQGQGIFKKLTLQLVEKCKDDGVDFIFNTPNKSSKQGYIKMGWSLLGNLRLSVRPVIGLYNQDADFYSKHSWNDSHLKGFSFDRTSDTIVTRSSTAYLSWRYGANPNANYYIVKEETENPGYLIIFRLKPYRFGMEFRICDFYLRDKTLTSALRKHLLRTVQRSGANILIWSSAQFRSLSILPTLPLGPAVTIRPLALTSDYLSFHSWVPSIGDLEVF